MIDLTLREYMREELRHTPTAFRRYMYERVAWDDRMVGLLGPRGVGKSTMVKQYILSHADHSSWLYVSADHTYFLRHSLMDLASAFRQEGGRHLVIDEIHKYPGWSRELKLIYDMYSDLHIVFTGSSVLDIRRGTSDLSRRVLLFYMQGLSLREYLHLSGVAQLPAYSIDDILAHRVTLPDGFHPLPHFRRYLLEGYYPFATQPAFALRLQQVVAQTTEVDIPTFAGMNLSTAHKLRRMLALVAASAPYKPSAANLAQELHVSKNDVPDYLLYLEMAGLIGQLRDETGGLRSLGKVEKVYIDNPNLMHVLADGEPNIGNVRETFFYNQTRVMNGVIASRVSDFCIGERTFEVGGRKKGKRQLEGVDGGIVVRDDIEEGYGVFVPLWMFGLNY